MADDPRRYDARSDCTRRLRPLVSRNSSVNTEAPPACRDLEELGDEECCVPCHRERARGVDRLSPVELDDGRMVRVCHAAFDALRETGLLTTAERMEEPDGSA